MLLNFGQETVCFNPLCHRALKAVSSEASVCERAPHKVGVNTEFCRAAFPENLIIKRLVEGKT